LYIYVLTKTKNTTLKNTKDIFKNKKKQKVNNIKKYKNIKNNLLILKT